eukprot:CAMPEP_0185727404 /NCGR_PEP_ID=MMETSP1171-20130828/3100_1 /TAXON_ID=374046 /ORGANISM="Helicotheca tamensis, Strain CCMP826" /LENGTH=130 /DNA_ID=CAMNT_0028395965 /DNA_START=44 /DNA_END=433 /DNA_ORIENTATION=+
MENTSDIELQKFSGHPASRRHVHNPDREALNDSGGGGGREIGNPERFNDNELPSKADSSSLSAPLLSRNKRHSGIVYLDTQGEDENKKGFGGGKATILVSVFNLANNVAGSGMLTLSSGKASGSGTGWIP